MTACIYCIHNPKAYSLQDNWSPKKAQQQQKKKKTTKRRRKEASLQSWRSLLLKDYQVSLVSVGLASGRVHIYAAIAVMIVTCWRICRCSDEEFSKLDLSQFCVDTYNVWECFL
jgi:hypothetical protein